MMLSCDTPAESSLLISPCIGRFEEEENGDTLNLSPLRFFTDDEKSLFEMEDPEKGWCLTDVIDQVGAYVIMVSSVEIKSPEDSEIKGQASIQILGKLVHHLEPSSLVDHSILSSIYF